MKPCLALVALLLVVYLSFWLSPAPQCEPDVGYWGHYQRVGPGLGFVVNHDGYSYLLLNGLVLLRHLCAVLSGGWGERWQFYLLAWVLVANSGTKAFF